MKPIIERSLEERYIYNNYLRVVVKERYWSFICCETIKFASLLYKGVLIVLKDYYGSSYRHDFARLENSHLCL